MENSVQITRRLLSVSEAQAATGLGRTKLYELIGTGELLSVKIGRLRKIPADALDNWLRALRATVH